MLNLTISFNLHVSIIWIKKILSILFNPTDIRSIVIDAKAVLLMLKLVNHDLNAHLGSPPDSADVSAKKEG